MADQADLVRQFCDVTGTTEERSRFYLDSSNWQLEVALSSFFEHGGGAEESAPPARAAPGSASTPASIPLLSASSDDSPPPSPDNKKAKNKRNANQKFATLSSLQRSSSSDEEEGEAFYAGGSERSGQQILGPNKNRSDFVAEMFKSVRERGAVVEEEPAGGGGRAAAFGGTGYRLGATADDHTPVPPTSARAQEGGVRSVRLQLFREGFTVDAGALRPYGEPANASFLEFVRRGEVPPELALGGGEVRVSLEDRRHEARPAASVGKLQAFTGAGHMLGSPTPPTVGATAPVAADVSDREANERAAAAALGLDEAQPTTTVQVRLADGGRLVGRFNHSHTVGHLRDYITTAVPAYQLRNFVLMTTFPSAELGDPAATLADAKLLNSLVVQRLK